MQKNYNVIGLLVLFVERMGGSSTKKAFRRRYSTPVLGRSGEVRCFNLLQLSDQDQILARELLLGSAG